MSIKPIRLATVLLTVFSLAFSACKKDNDANPAEKGVLKIEFEPTVDGEDFELNKNYVNSSGETYAISTFKFYVSNIKLKTADGTEYVVPQDSSYFLIHEEEEDQRLITLNNVPAGNYNQVTFTIGVDSLRSTADLSKRKGVLDPASDEAMYWVWNSGYIFFKLEGSSPQAPPDPAGEKKFRYHIGGYGGYDTKTINNLKTITIPMGTSQAQVRTGKQPQIHFSVDVHKFFQSPTPLSIAAYSTVMWGDYSAVIANNYATIFTFEHVHN
jgi:hypothetical protein